MFKQQLLDHSEEESPTITPTSLSSIVESDEVSFLQVRNLPSSLQQEYESGKESNFEPFKNESSEENFHDSINYHHHQFDNIIPTSTIMRGSQNQDIKENPSFTMRFTNLIDSMPVLKSMLGWLACISVHTLYGTHPIFSRYLQAQSPNKFSPMLLVTSCHLAALLLYSPRIVYLLIVYMWNKWKNRKINKEMNVVTLHHQEMKLTIFERIKKGIRFSLPLISFFWGFGFGFYSDLNIFGS